LKRSFHFKFFFSTGHHTSEPRFVEVRQLVNVVVVRCDSSEDQVAFLGPGMNSLQ